MRTESADHVGVLLDNYGAEDDRERIIVRRFKFEELRIEEIQDHERGVPNKGSRQESIMSVQDINIQSHVLISLKDSKKVGADLFFRAIRERIIVRRFKFEELRIEEIQDLEVSNLF
ncbi:hypothetical protein SASPL_147166 [Salvia splendens]|uniref:Uncharacterized protein n=1 Tax=Salvia splendens TaxID=180675 RepID=A0A8X8Z5K6_SALSN|nr:hypothetical protein SASPL_147166 [Salvia splendens]